MRKKDRERVRKIHEAVSKEGILSREEIERMLAIKYGSTHTAKRTLSDSQPTAVGAAEQNPTDTTNSAVKGQNSQQKEIIVIDDSGNNRNIHINC